METSSIQDSFVTISRLYPGSCQQYGHSCLGGHGKRDGSDAEAQNALLKNPIAARYNGLLREMLARRLYGANAYDWPKYQDSQEAVEKKNVDYVPI